MSKPQPFTGPIPLTSLAADVVRFQGRFHIAEDGPVVTANLLAAKLKNGAVSVADLEQVQKRRELPVRLIQAMQVVIHRRIP